MASADLRRIFLEITGDSSSARRQLTELRASLAAVDRQNAEATVTVDAGAAEARITELEARLLVLGTMDPSVEVDAEIGGALAEIAALQASLQAIGSGDATARVDIDTSTAQAKVATLRLALAELDGADIDPRIRINVDQAKARLAELQADFIRASREVENFAGPRFDDDGRVTDAYAAKLRNLRTSLKDLQTETNTTERSMRRWVQGLITPADNLNRSFTGLLGAIKQINPVVQGLSLVIFSSLIPALVGLAASAGGAVAGILALGPAALAAGGAMAVGLIAVVKSVGQVLDLRKQKEAAQASQTRQSTQVDERAKAAAAALAEAERSVRDAKQQRTTATRQVAVAEERAAEGIANAQRGAADASNDLRRTTVDAFRAMADAARDAKSAVLDLQDAQLGVKEADLATREAEQALKDFAKGGGKALQELGKKFDDVSYDPKKLAGIIRSARSSGAVGDDDALKLEDLTLRVERARLREKQAAESVTESEVKLKEARERQIEFAKKGIAAYEPYVTAVQRARDAERDYARLLKDGIAGNPQVIAAREAVRDANERIVASTQRVRDALKAQADATKTDTTGPMALYREQLKKLTAGQRELYDSLEDASGPFKKFRDLIADPILSAAAAGIRDISGALSGANGWASKLGQVGKKNIEDFLASLKADPKNAQGLKIIGEESLKSAKILGGPAFRNFVRLMRNFAVALLPLLNEGLQKLADKLGIAADNTNDWQALQDAIRPLVRLAGGFLGVIGAIGKAMTALASAGEPVFTPFLAFIKEGINGFTRFAKSAKGGDRIRKFFADTMPLVKTLITNIVLFGKVLLQAYEVVAPVLQPILAVTGLVLKAFSFLLEKILAIPAPVRSLLAAFIPFGFIAKAIGGVVSLLGKIPVIGRIIALVFGGIGKLLGVVFRPIAAVIEGLFLRIVLAARNSAGAIAAPFRIAAKVLGIIVKGIVQGFATGWTAIKEVFGPVVGFFETTFGAIGKVVEGVFSGVVSIIKGAINLVISSLNFVIKAINAIPNIDTPFGSIGIPDIPEIPKLAKGGLATGSTLANIGEAGDEAVIPLKAAVLRSIGHAIAKATPGARRDGVASTTGGAREITQNFHITSPPGTNPDAEAVSRKIGRAVAGVS